tara:strand:- start:736 stop:999 length:264 start_codon:yes stop_codon:yes gene_type:complete
LSIAPRRLIDERSFWQRFTTFLDQLAAILSQADLWQGSSPVCVDPRNTRCPNLACGRQFLDFWKLSRLGKERFGNNFLFWKKRKIWK